MASLPVALQARGPEWKDPLETYKQTASLADLLQQRRYRALQEESIRQKLEDERRERQELVNFQTGLGRLGDRPSLRQLTELSPTYGPKYYEQQRLAESAAEVQKKNAAEYANLQKKIWVYKTRATLLEPDPQKKQEIFRTFSDELVKYNMLTPEQAARPLDEKTLEQLYEQIDPGEYSKLKDEQKKRTSEYEKAQLEAEQKQIENAQHYTKTITDQASWDRFRNFLPKRMQDALPAKFSPEVVAQTESMLLTGQQRMQEARAQATETRLGQPNTLGDFVRIFRSPDSTPQQKTMAAAAIQDFQNQARAGAMNITPNQNVANEARLRDDYRQESKRYISIRDARNNILGAAKAADAGNPTADITLIYSYIKMQDPGSTVMQGEAANAQNAGGVPERIRAIYNNLLRGDKLDKNTRAGFVAEANRIHEQAYADHQQTSDLYKDIATRSGMDPRNVVIDYTTAKPAEIIERNGVKFRFKGGDRKRQENWERVP